MKPMIATRPYYASDAASAAHYDLVTAHDRSLGGDIDLYADLIPPGGSVLELGTGTGRIAIPLAERGFHVTGVDIAPAMLDQARARHAALPADVGARLHFVYGDMRSLTLGARFDTVIAGFFTLAHVQPSVAWKRVFSGIVRHLEPGGRFAAHLPLADKMARTAPSAGQLLFQTATDRGDPLAIEFVEQINDPRTGRLDLTLDYVTVASERGACQRSRERYTLFHGDPDHFAERAGLRRSAAPIPLGDCGQVHIFEKTG